MVRTCSNKNRVSIIKFQQFSKELLYYFEMGADDTITAYNKEFSDWLLLVPTMVVEEKSFHYSQRLKNRIRVEIELSKVATLPDAMMIADRMDSRYNNHRRDFIINNGPGS